MMMMMMMMVCTADMAILEQQLRSTSLVNTSAVAALCRPMSAPPPTSHSDEQSRHSHTACRQLVGINCSSSSISISSSSSSSCCSSKRKGKRGFV